ncbi:hypothetical protein TTHERM_001164190 (macronuclear) [Tetrahymena thermophila SB210]|uniref:Uncharacterized protein n=1 Tax=Tetrahymena thermophila (strain SB210) TaxID=312017 RepID=W7WXU8_TETTS|nr:hypothetical protein TTHERM_001164190 [Tetrahymena thermophila SB210]EWS71665.1 hypothetical protein TTHERM_001164190 [Tetrahymena thermophila SB210]|eukprot:XP_012655804.1 hypothetical protein TTHERM_001164190 [Tetrahymena thermophila SB210]
MEKYDNSQRKKFSIHFIPYSSNLNALVRELTLMIQFVELKSLIDGQLLEIEINSKNQDFQIYLFEKVEDIQNLLNQKWLGALYFIQISSFSEKIRFQQKLSDLQMDSACIYQWADISKPFYKLEQILSKFEAINCIIKNYQIETEDEKANFVNEMQQEKDKYLIFLKQLELINKEYGHQYRKEIIFETIILNNLQQNVCNLKHYKIIKYFMD